MPCFHPLRGYVLPEKTSAGKRKIVFSKSGLKTWTEIQVPCKQCTGCRLEKSRQWAVRAHHESTLYKENCFITLTYDDDKLPWDYSLNKDHFQKFMKRLRAEISPKKIRFFHAGEYGKATPENDFIARPHYHALIFNHNFDDLELFTVREGVGLYTSDTLAQLWESDYSGGHCSVGELTFESAAYVARYVMKKVNGDRADEHYRTTHPITGEIIDLQPEYSTQSNRPGIGAPWYDRYKNDCYPSDSISVRGAVQSPPKYYDYLYDLDPCGDLECIQKSRKQKMRKHIKDNTPERLAVRETVKLAQIKTLTRKL